MELAGNNIMFVHIKGKSNVLVDAISRFKTLNIYNGPWEIPKAQVGNNTQVIVMEICATNMHNVSTSMLHTEGKWDKTCRKLVSQIYYGNKSRFKSVIMSTSGILQKHQYVHSLQHDVTVAPHSLVPTFLHEFHDSKGHQGTSHTFEKSRRSYW